MSRLAVLVDGIPMPEEEARAFWERFSAWMEEHRGDLAGFAAREGFASVHPGVDAGRPVLRASRSAAQRAYAPVTADAGSRESGSGGSGTRQGEGGSGRPAAARTRKKPKPPRS
jgi:hypothetical protein